MQSVSKIVYESVSSANMRKAINTAYTALFEGLTPQQKTRRALRQSLPTPPGGWDAPAVGESGTQLRTSENSRPMSFAECLEYNVRNLFFHDGGRSNPKFEPGVARIAYTELGLWPESLVDWTGKSHTPDWPKAKVLSSILRNITSSHANDYDFDLNGMTFEELSARFAHGSSDTGAVNEEADGSGCRYKVTWIPDFKTAQQYAKYTSGTQTWCLTEDRSQWNRYMKGNTVKMYICTRPGFEDVPGVPGDNCPLDEYGLSMIGVSVNPDGSLETCCTRWNHLHGGSDMAMDEAELCKVLNVRKLSDVCPPYTEDELESHSRLANNILLDIINKPETWTGTRYAMPSRNFMLPGVDMWEVYYDGIGWYVPLTKDGTPLLKHPLTYWKLYDNVTLLGHFNPDGFNCVTFDEEDGSPFRDCSDDEIVLYSAISKRVFYGYETGCAEDLDIDDAISYSTAPGTYDFRPDDQLIHGIALTMNVAFEGTYLFDTVKMDFDTDASDGYVDIQTGNLFSKDSILYLVTKDRLVNYTDQLAKSLDPGYPRKMPNTGRPYKWHAELLAWSSDYPTVAVLLRSGLTGWVFIVNPIDGSVIKTVDGVAGANVSKEKYGDDCIEIEYEDGQRGVIRLDGKTVVAT